MLEKEFNYYLSHQGELLPQYAGKYIVIVGEQVVGTYATEAEAYFKSAAVYEAGTFLVQLCTPGADAYTVTYHSRVAF